MGLARGTRLGPYEILAPLGAGGMGEVYRAHDARLDRTVAIKVLPAELSQSSEYRQRFEREARAASRLNHPHICTVHDVGHYDGIDFLVMEYLEGETLESRLSRGPLPLGEVLTLGMQVADALDRAHREGLVHRDLKPGNIMLTASGAKLLDFGLAKSTRTLAASSLTAAPTATSPLTAQGTILGTLHYMAPEQLEGKETDARTDIFALGSVLYEAACGRRPFVGETQATLIAAIMSSEPAMMRTYPADAPPALDRLLRTCLAKDPENRWQTCHDVRLQLQAIAQADVPTGEAGGQRLRGARVPWALAALGIVSATVLGTLLVTDRPAPPGRAVHSSVLPPEGTKFDFGGPNVGALTLSPDGRFLTFSAPGPDGVRRLWLRPMGGREATPIPASDRGMYPFWSPDSRSIGFFADGELRTMPAAGGQVVTVCEALEPRGGAWGRDDVILFTPHWQDQPIHRVDAGGGEPVAVTEMDSSRNESTHRWPAFLPDGRHFLFLAGSHKEDPTSGDNAIYIGSVDTPGEVTLLMRARSNVLYADGHLLFLRGTTLLAQPFDPRRRRLLADPRPVAEGVHYETSFFQGAFAASASGLLAYQRGGLNSKNQLRWVDRNGDIENVFEPDEYSEVVLSPDGNTLAVGLGDPTDVWLLDLRRRQRSRLTSTGAMPTAWSADGQSVVYQDGPSIDARSWVLRTDGSRPAARLVDLDTGHSASDWSRDGRFVVLETWSGNGFWDLWMARRDPPEDPRPLLATEFREFHGRLSPDARWLAFGSDRSGREEVYLRPFPEGGVTRPVSDGGGSNPIWGRDGRELYYLSSAGRMMSVAVGSGPDAPLGSPQALFDAEAFPGALRPYDVSPDGRFLINHLLEEEGARAIELITNWNGASGAGS